MSVQALVIVLIIFLLLLLIGILIGWRLGAQIKPPPSPPPPAPPPPPYKIPDTFDEPALSTALAMRLAGSPANGARPIPVESNTPVIWVDAGDEVLVHLNSANVRILDRMLLVAVDLESDQTGRASLVVVLAVAGEGEPAGLVATTDELPRGNALLAARWGRALQAAVWASLLGLAKDHAGERRMAPLGISAASGRLRLQAGTPLQAQGGTQG